MKPPSFFASMGVGLAVCTPGVAKLPLTMDKVQVDCVLNSVMVQWCIGGLGLNSERRWELGGRWRGGGIGQDIAALHLNVAIADVPPVSKASIKIAPKSSRT